MKHLKDLTLKEYELYLELLKEDVVDSFEILKLFGYDIALMDIQQLKEAEASISNMKLTTVGIFKEYVINGTILGCNMSLLNIKAAQFIDFQNYIANKNFKLQEILSVFLIPKKEVIKRYGLLKKKVKIEYVEQEYSSGYNIFDIQDLIYNNLTIGEANELASFFLKQSVELLNLLTNYFQNQNK